MSEVNEFNAIRISLASPEQIRSWSYGEVTKPETINYRTLKPEKDGLFCERIFGPTKDYECYCGKYKKIRYKGTICDRCGVEVTKAKVRRERMGHIELAAPVSHIWFLKGTPSRLGLLLDLSPRSLERVVYFAQYIVTRVNTEDMNKSLEELREKQQQEIETLRHASTETENALLSRLEEEMIGLNNRREAEVKALDEAHEKALSEASTAKQKKKIEDKYLAEMEDKQKSFELEEKRKKDSLHDEVELIRKKLQEEEEKIEGALELQMDDVDDIRPRRLLTEGRYRELKGKYPDLFEASMGTEAILEILKETDPSKERDLLITEIRTTSGQRRKKAIKRLRVVEAFRRSGNKPEWMILSILPVLPPDLRPMVQLDGGRFATSDLNDLYRRVINRNNRLKRLLELGAPDIIIRNEKRMLQEAVDSLIDNGRSGRATTGAANRRLKSLSDMLRGKQGRFRQNLLGKRVDYSGRSVITVGPELKLHQCGLPRRMALELFKPFVMSRLVQLGVASNIKSARRIVERAKPEVWDVLDEVVRGRPVLLNRAPTLHRLSIQAFEPVLIDGSAIQIHPLVCAAFNADFDGDQMAVHLPLSRSAIREAREVMLSIYNMLLPSSGDPIVAPTLDMVLGCYYLTSDLPMKTNSLFGSFEEARLAYDMGAIALRSRIKVKENGKVLETTVGRIIFNDILPEKMRFINQTMDKSSLKKLIGECYNAVGAEETATVADNIKGLGFKFATMSGTTIAANDIEVPKAKAKILERADEELALIEGQYRRGLITSEELYVNAVQVWTKATDSITSAIQQGLPRYGGIYMMATSGAKGNIAQIRQMAGMRGLMTDPSGRIIELPIRSSFREGLSVLEYFISTHGARKGLADTALRTSDSGYLTRRLIDVAQDTIVGLEDCGTTGGAWIAEPQEEGLLSPLHERLVGRIAAAPVVITKTGEEIVALGDEIDEEKARRIVKAGIKSVFVRSPLACQARQGICQKCYGRDLARRALVCKGVAVGIIAAQSIGEPGTQLTMRTFHTGGVAGVDITSGLPRVEELFEARSPKGQAVISEIDGAAEVIQSEEGRKIRVTSAETYRDQYVLPPGAELAVKDGDMVGAGAVLAQTPAPEDAGSETPAEGEKALVPSNQIVSQVAGKVALEDGRIFIDYEEREEREYVVPAAASIKVANGARVMAGEQLTDGHINPQDILRIMGRDAVQRYLVDEVQKVYRSQGVNINDKHIEVITRQMLRKVRVDSSGDTSLLPGELVDRFVYEDVNAKVLAEGGEPATAQTVLLGITRASLNTESFLAAASFQETTRVLTEAAISGKIDRLQGLKENVIIGRLVPTRCLPEEPIEEQDRGFLAAPLPPDTSLLDGSPL